MALRTAGRRAVIHRASRCRPPVMPWHVIGLAVAAPAGLLPSRWLEQHDRDDPLGRPLLVHLVAVVVVIDQPPQSSRSAPSASRGRTGIFRPPTSIVTAPDARAGCNTRRGDGPRLPWRRRPHTRGRAGYTAAACCAAGRTWLRGCAAAASAAPRPPPAGRRQRDEAPVDDREYVHEQPAAQPGPRERLRQLVKRRLVPLRAESLLHRPRLAGDRRPGGRLNRRRCCAVTGCPDIRSCRRAGACYWCLRCV